MTIDEQLARVIEKFKSDEIGAYHQALTLAEAFILRNHDDLLSALADQRRYRFLRELPEEYRETDWLWSHSGESLDAAIDEAIIPLAQEGE